MGAYLMEKLESLKVRHPIIKEVRGVGLMVGAELTQDGSAIAERCMERGLLINCTAGTVLRFLPAMTVTRKEIDCGIEILEGVLHETSQSQ
jgi:acetylornithine/N-succinyldiaminopimelate aminotransferase